MDKRTAVVTGGIGGLGTAICIALARAGRRVVAADLGGRQERIDAFLGEVDGLDVRFQALDVTDFDACGAFVQALEAAGEGPDILVNAAGITRDTTLRKMERAQWDAVLSVNLDSVFNLCRHVVDGMCARGFGRIVNISSVNGQTGQFGQTNYSAAKAGMHGFTMALAREVARKGVTANSVSPGYCETAMVMAIPDDIRQGIVDRVPVGRLGRPEEIARTVVFLSDDDAGYITGANIPVNGGLYMGF
ncbi:3-oxoacyl-[acyl-carrier-protein] reductase [Luteimonas sp. J16]|jgi:acetoacetyl-CoA reductase|uniref:acetoacetyl-CoA reductase n=1 Tax=unclassified Luteimonas TaxID=2629088 RepID=UPI00047BF5A6|nr:MULTISPECIES: acetoacetyl-CoA reductase [unclassified Luteimonas]TWG86209.1 3-oxoacyl-[acyl-carrier-protein] reductase [Luteimonas sp. J16]